MSPDSSPAAPTGGPPALRAVLDEVLRTGAALASVEVARTRALAAAGHLALDVLTDRGAPGRVDQLPGGLLRWTSPTGRTYTDEPLPYSPAVRFLPDDPPPPEPDDSPPPF